MVRDGEKIVVTSEEASNVPSKQHGVRWVLAVSLILAVIAMSLIWVIPALS
jgi:hypothetical protein